MAEVPSSSPSAPKYASYKYHSRHETFPYTSRDFLRQDESPDTRFYSSPRFVTHIDDNAVSLLLTYYLHNLPHRGRILDFCSSWVSHFPKELEEVAVQTAKAGPRGGARDGLEVVGMGMEKRELDANPILSTRIVQDLNEVPHFSGDVAELDAAVCVVSVDYLTQPLAVLKSLLEKMKSGGSVHLIISNRCFPTKAVGRWLRIGEQERLNMVGDYLWHSGWRDIEVLTLCDGKGDGGGFFGFGRPDPLWVVRGRKQDA